MHQIEIIFASTGRDARFGGRSHLVGAGPLQVLHRPRMWRTSLNKSISDIYRSCPMGGMWSSAAALRIPQLLIPLLVRSDHSSQRPIVRIGIVGARLAIYQTGEATPSTSVDSCEGHVVWHITALPLEPRMCPRSHRRRLHVRYHLNHNQPSTLGATQVNQTLLGVFGA